MITLFIRGSLAQTQAQTRSIPLDIQKDGSQHVSGVLPTTTEATLERYLGDLAHEMTRYPNQVGFLTHAQADHLLARIYARRHAARYPDERSSDEWFSRAHAHLDNSVRMLESSLICGLDFASLKKLPPPLRLEDFLVPEAQLSKRFDAHAGILDMYDSERSRFRKMLARRGVDIEEASKSVIPKQQTGG